MDVFNVLQCACLNPVAHYDLDVGQLRIGDAADFIVVEDLKEFKVLQTYIDGQLVAEDEQSKISSVPFSCPNQFNTKLKVLQNFAVNSTQTPVKVIEALNGQLITNAVHGGAKNSGGNLVSNVLEDVLKIAVVNRYEDAPPALAFIKNFGLKEGAIASSVAHDSHNIIAVGVSDALICKALNTLIQEKGGICAVSDTEEKVLPLPVAGIMSDGDCETVGKSYQQIDHMAKQMGSTLSAPFMTLSFMALLVIPSLKLSDKGLFDGEKFEFTSLKI